MIKKLLILALICLMPVALFTACSNKSNVDSNVEKTEKEKVKETTEIEAENTKDLIEILAELMGKDDSEVLLKLGTGVPTGEPVLSRKYEADLLDEKSQVFVNLGDSKVYDISAVLNGKDFNDYENKLTEIFGEKTGEEENTLKEGSGRRATIWNLKNGSVLKLIQVNSQLSISIQVDTDK